jgi:ABC-type transport system substrate-binding protein
MQEGFERQNPLSRNHLKRRIEMKRRFLVLFSVLLVASLLLAACATPTEAPVATEAPETETPVVTEAPVAAEPLEITLAFRVVDRAYLPSPDKVAQEIQAQLSEVGINVTLKEMESAAFIDATAAGSEGFYLLGWNADYPDATNFYDYHFATSENMQFGDLYDDMVAEIRAAGKLSDPEARQAHYDTINQMLKDYLMMIPVANGGSSTVFGADVEGAHSSPLGNEVFSVMSNGADQLVWMQNGEPAALWCSDETDGETLRACEQVYEPLLAFEVGGTDVVPALAESYSANETLDEWTFTIREGVTFHNGAVLDVNDVVATFASYWDAASPNHTGRTGNFEYFGAFFGAPINTEAVEAELVDTDGLLSLTAPSCDYGGEFASIAAVDASTVKFTLCYPDPAFPSKVAFSVFSILDKDHLDLTAGDSVAISDNPNGTGPYMVRQWNRGDSVVFDAFPGYWGEAAKTPTLIFRWSEQSAQRLLELQAGTVDGIDNPGPDDIASIEADANLALYPRNGFNIFYIGFNHNLAPFDNLLVRQAVTFAIDRARIVEQFYPVGSSVSDSFVPAFVYPGASPNVPWWPYDPEKAKELLVEAGYAVP